MNDYATPTQEMLACQRGEAAAKKKTEEIKQDSGFIDWLTGAENTTAMSSSGAATPPDQQNLLGWWLGDWKKIKDAIDEIL
jgi:hypothetical protein